MVGCTMFVLSAKLRSLKPILKKWNKETFENIHLKFTQATIDVNKIQSLINDACYNNDLELEKTNA